MKWWLQQSSLYAKNSRKLGCSETCHIQIGTPFHKREVLSYRDFNKGQIQFVDMLKVLFSLESLCGKMEKQKGVTKNHGILQLFGFLNLSIILHVTNNTGFQNLCLCLASQERLVMRIFTTFLLKIEKGPFVQICHFPNTSLWKVQKSNSRCNIAV